MQELIYEWKRWITLNITLSVVDVSQEHFRCFPGTLYIGINAKNLEMYQTTHTDSRPKKNLYLE